MKIIRKDEEQEGVRKILAGQSSVIIDTDPLSIYEKVHPPFSFPIPVPDLAKVVRRPDLRSRNIMIFSSLPEDIERIRSMDLPENVFYLYDNTDGSWPKYYESSYYSKIDPNDLYERLEEFVVVDIREDFEKFSGVIENSLSHPFSRIIRRDVDLQKGLKYAIICAHGNRSRVAVEFLSSLGFEVYDVPGGIEKWKREGLPLTYPEDL